LASTHWTTHWNRLKREDAATANTIESGESPYQPWPQRQLQIPASREQLIEISIMDCMF
jgi:hypothetical protein